jgi:hypothetical protein
VAWAGSGHLKLGCLPTSHVLLAEFRQIGEIEKLRIRKYCDFGGFQSPEVRKKNMF